MVGWRGLDDEMASVVKNTYLADEPSKDLHGRLEGP
jgi:hypothetical protein